MYLALIYTEGFLKELTNKEPFYKTLINYLSKTHR